MVLFAPMEKTSSHTAPAWMLTCHLKTPESTKLFIFKLPNFSEMEKENQNHSFHCCKEIHCI